MYSPGLDGVGLLLGHTTNPTLGKWWDENIFGPLGMVVYFPAVRRTGGAGALDGDVGAAFEWDVDA